LTNKSNSAIITALVRTKGSTMKPTYNTRVALATAVSAFEINGHLIYKDPTRVEDRTLVPNRQIIRETLDSEAVVNQQQRDAADEIVVYLQQAEIMQTLTKGTADSFLVQINKLLANETVKANELGLLAWAPKLMRDYQAKDRVREISSQYETKSRYVGREREKITVDFTMIDKRYFKETNSWLVYGCDSDGNLMSYWANRADKVCETGKIQGRVKSHRQDSYRSNAKVTFLNFVKVL